MLKKQVGNGFILAQVSSKVGVIYNPTATPKTGWRSVYVGFNVPSDLVRYRWSTFKKILIPSIESETKPIKYEERLAKRMNDKEMGWDFRCEIKIAGNNPTPFWGEQGKQLVLELAAYLDQPAHTHVLKFQAENDPSYCRIILNDQRMPFSLEVYKQEQVQLLVDSMPDKTHDEVRRELIAQFNDLFKIDAIAAAEKRRNQRKAS